MTAMHDELVKRLRILSGTDNISEFDEAADVIEELDADKAALNGTVTNLLEQIKDLASPSWNPVTERLPREQETVLTWGKQGVILIDWRHDNKWCFCRGVTHWMPLPEPPKEE